MISRPIIRPIDKYKFELVEGYKYKDINIPVGYRTNGANIPRIFWCIFPPNSPEYISASLIHDYICDVADGSVEDNAIIELVKSKEMWRIFKFADDSFYEAMVELGCSKLKCKLFYISVRLYHIIRYRNKK